MATKAEQVYEEVNELVVSGTKKADAFKQSSPSSTVNLSIACAVPTTARSAGLRVADQAAHASERQPPPTPSSRPRAHSAKPSRPSQGR